MNLTNRQAAILHAALIELAINNREAYEAIIDSLGGTEYNNVTKEEIEKLRNDLAVHASK